MKFVSRPAIVGLIVACIGGCKASEAPPPPSQPQPMRPTAQQQMNTTPPPVAPAHEPAPQTTPGTKPVAVVRASSTTSGDDVIATIDDIPITRAQIEKPLIEAHGLNFLAKVAQLELTKREAAKMSITVTPADVSAETDRYLIGLFNEERDPILREMNSDLEKAQAASNSARVAQLQQDLKRERYRLLDQLLQQQKLTRPDFDLVMQTNTYLRKIALSQVKKESITEENLQTAFNTIYGEKVQVRHIALANTQEVNEAKRRLAAGEPFEQVARDMSKNQQSGALGGELPPFARGAEAYPQQFRDVAFSLSEGQVSDPVMAANGYHLIKLEKRIPPKIVKLEDVKESVRDQLYNAQLEAFIRLLSTRLKQESATALKINEPELKRQFDQQVNKSEGEVRDRDQVRRELERKRLLNGATEATQESEPANERAPTTAPSNVPSTRSATPQAATTAPASR